MRFEHTEVMNFRGAFRGMRNPKQSWAKSDSIDGGFRTDKNGAKHFDEDMFMVGLSDLKLAQSLIRAGSEHRKFMRQIFVCVDITAPEYWWNEFDTYKVGTVANSTSKMHKLSETPITTDCFETDDYQDVCASNDCSFTDFWGNQIAGLELLRQEFVATKEKKYWKELIRLLPESWLQTRTVTMSYENLLSMCSKGQRRFHKLNEWSGQDKADVENFIKWARSLPYAQELIFLDELPDENKSSFESDSNTHV